MAALLHRAAINEPCSAHCVAYARCRKLSVEIRPGKSGHFNAIFPHIITGSIASSAKRGYLSYSEADFEVFRSAGATRCTDGGQIWHRGPRVPSSPPC